MTAGTGRHPAPRVRPVELTGDEWRAGVIQLLLDRREADRPTLGGVADPLASMDLALPPAALAAVVADHEPLAQLVLGLDTQAGPAPFVVGITGAVAAGKSLTARVLGALLTTAGWRPAVVSTDGFLYPNRVLAERGLTDRKGFPESYDQARLVAFLTAIRAGETVDAPVYDHERYDVLAEPGQRVDRPDVLVVEGVNVLQDAPGDTVVADLLDYSVYLDADEADLHRWFLARLRALRSESADDPDSFFAGFAGFSDDEFIAVGEAVWAGINRPNLIDHIAPTRDRADLVLEKGPDHTVRRVVVRRP